jgi:nucleotidyltransferase/DNA polymerase involved in DNA repair
MTTSVQEWLDNKFKPSAFHNADDTAKRKKQSASATRRWQDSEQREHLEKMRKQQNTLEVCDKIRKHGVYHVVPVVDPNGVVYPSAYEAARQLGLKSAASIHRRVKHCGWRKLPKQRVTYNELGWGEIKDVK